MRRAAAVLVCGLIAGCTYPTEAIHSLGLLRDLRAVPASIAAIERSDVQIPAAEALARIGDRRGAEAVIHALDHSPHRAWFVRPLGSFGLPVARARLVEAARDPGLPGFARRDALLRWLELRGVRSSDRSLPNDW